MNKAKIVCVEYTFTAEELAAGLSWKGLGGLEGLTPVDHIDIEFEPKGHGAHHLGARYMVRVFLAPESELKKMYSGP